MAKSAEEKAAAKAAREKSKKDKKEKKEKLAAGVDEDADLTAQDRMAALRSVTGVLASRPAAQDIKVINFSLAVAGAVLVNDCQLELTLGTRYGLVGNNGSGKTMLLNAIARREVDLPSHLDMFHLHEEAPPTDRTAVESVIDHVREELQRLEKLEEAIIEESGPDDDRLELISSRITELDPEGFEATATKILVGLGFDNKMLQRKTKDMSGGWRMRVSLARALFAAPTLLLLDEPTNHLDLEACVWLEEHLKTYPKCLLVVSHSQDFLNSVCNKIVWLNNKTLTYYSGNYATFCKLVENEEKIQSKLYEKQQADIAKLTEFVAVNKANKKTAKSAASKEKVLDKITSEKVDRPNLREKTLSFQFPECTKLPPPVIPFSNVSFSYSGKKEDYLFENLEFGIDCDTRIALVGPNGVGKSTLLKLMAGDLTPTEGDIRHHSHLSLGRYHQHSAEVLDPELSALEFFQKTYPEAKHTVEVWRGYLGMFGLQGHMQTAKISTLSDGQKSRIVFAMLCRKTPNILLFDEPTNHLDVDAIDLLADSIKAYKGGLVLVSHDFRLIDQVAEQIWVVENKNVSVWKGDIHEYKRKLARGMGFQY
mmetsp:Transcript_11929/g.33599  ORF Transcript_11929/g.33599 Transcript_11929/m.33599 type:complete len:595 (-) Transcript_11929:205-1989(-)